MIWKGTSLDAAAAIGVLVPVPLQMVVFEVPGAAAAPGSRMCRMRWTSLRTMGHAKMLRDIFDNGTTMKDGYLPYA